MKIKDQDYWENRYKENNTPWDIGYPATPLKSYFDQIEDKNKRILIPGCGNGYEAIYLYEQGFSNTFIIDIAPMAVEFLKKSVPEKFHSQLILGDYFEHNETYDLIVEQTFFCALHPDQRPEYVKQTAALLNPGGKLMGLLFDDPLNTEHPPYGGDKEEYERHFSPYFDIDIMETAHNSIKPRAGRELFILMRKKEL